MDELLNEINYLSKKSKSNEGLTDEEKIRQAELRKKYLEIFRNNFKNQLDNIEFVDEPSK
ncbi:MAG: DUF896 domain-containing protein [Fusobacteria bacterium]|nr:DUF896 domain-containing protein [Fusobacteriota bacterium]